jgi:hypothetical protein
MNADEKAIIDYLKGWPYTFVSGREIARKVGGRARYAEDRGWAIPILAQMVQAGTIEVDHFGCFKLKAQDLKKKKWSRNVSPQILKILKSSGKNFDGIAIDDDDDANEPTAYIKPPASGSDGGGG